MVGFYDVGNIVDGSCWLPGIPTSAKPDRMFAINIMEKGDKPKPKDKKVKKEKEGKVDNFAKWGFISSVAGLVSLFFLPLLGFVLLPVGIGFSIAGLSATSKNKTRGKVLAIAGLTIGSAGILLTLLAIVLVVAFFASF